MKKLITLVISLTLIITSIACSTDNDISSLTDSTPSNQTANEANSSSVDESVISEDTPNNEDFVQENKGITIDEFLKNWSNNIYVVSDSLGILAENDLNTILDINNWPYLDTEHSTNDNRVVTYTYFDIDGGSIMVTIHRPLNSDFIDTVNIIVSNEYIQEDVIIILQIVCETALESLLTEQTNTSVNDVLFEVSETGESQLDNLSVTGYIDSNGSFDMDIKTNYEQNTSSQETELTHIEIETIITEALSSTPTLEGFNTSVLESINTVFYNYEWSYEKHPGSDKLYIVTFKGDYSPNPEILGLSMNGSISYSINMESYEANLHNDPDNLSATFIVHVVDDIS